MAMKRVERQMCRFKILRIYPIGLERNPIYLGQYNKVDTCIEVAELQRIQEKNYKEVKKGMPAADYQDFKIFEYDMANIDGYSQEPILVNYCTLDKIVDTCASSVVEAIGHMDNKPKSRSRIIN